jgi:coenzyme F420-reducing hydrogenase beta subunit
MKYDKDGFLHPVVDNERCINCGICNKTCPILNKFTRHNFISPATYVGWNRNETILIDSTSGGAFSAISDSILNNGGLVYASMMDADLKVFFTKVEIAEDLYLVRGSKYIQSEPGFIYRDIKESLGTGKKILFIGCPCQVAALYSYLENIDTETLYTIDLVCHGVGSTYFFRQYVQWNEEKFKTKMIKFTARDKKRGWSNLTVKQTYLGNLYKYVKSTSDVFMKAYYSGLIYRESCYQCLFANMPRIGDLTIGDYYGIDENVISKKSFYKGISLILINNNKGSQMLNDMYPRMVLIKRELDEAINTNSCLIHPIPRHKQRDKFFELRDGMTMKQIDKKFCQYSLKRRVSLLIGKKITKFLQRIIH